MPSSPSSASVTTAPPRVTRDRHADLIVALIALALAVWVTSGLWRDPNGRAITVNSSDQALFEWLLAFGGHTVSHGENPLFTYLINVPDGVNLAVNTSITVYAVVFAPLTYLIGPPATFLVILTLNLAATAVAWYWLLSRHLVRTSLAAAVGGLFIGFSPGMVSHANAHLNWTAGWLVPLLVWRVFVLRRSAHPLRDGAILGVLVAIAFSIAAEGLFFTALALGLFVAVWALHPANRVEARAVLPSFLRGLAVTTVVAGVLLAYPLWLHFAGPQRFHGTGFDSVIHSEDIAAYAAYPRRSLAGEAGLGTSLAPNPTEENSFFGLPLLLLTVACFVLLWRSATPRRRATLWGLGVLAVAFTTLSFGPVAKINGHRTDLPMPFDLLGHLPVVNAALPARLALVVTPVIGLLLAFAVDHLRHHRPRRAAAVAWTAAFTVALVPLFPTPLLTTVREPIPRFITSGAWRDYVSPGGVLTPAPLALDVYPDGQRWQAYALANRQGEFAIPSGFFLGPGGPDGRGRIGPVPRPFSALLDQAARSGLPPIVTEGTREEVRADLEHWRIETVVLPDEVHGAKWPVDEEAVRRTLTMLFGEPERVEDVWLWRVGQR
ncbi:DUF2079 domain-containing protein [Micromonospora craniellae]|uniref:DUF2079 domain-containing protein n=1 Tax=Micromonospora craniellae TaxID=2294034 RepID=A0A372FYS5_9ACTN|nr:DUF2079 domain-containing protein [Micromonospora craniellae]QOC90964.1 DUF2079 domain-containing protein [Micromonospora craniellae]RFS45935.1 DUF2079 domain-containing protein [Micromonospora craniellae]